MERDFRRLQTGKESGFAKKAFKDIRQLILNARI